MGMDRAVWGGLKWSRWIQIRHLEGAGFLGLFWCCCFSCSEWLLTFAIRNGAWFSIPTKQTSPFWFLGVVCINERCLIFDNDDVVLIFYSCVYKRTVFDFDTENIFLIFFTGVCFKERWPVFDTDEVFL